MNPWTGLDRLFWAGLGVLVGTGIALIVGRLHFVHPAAKVWACRLAILKALASLVWTCAILVPSNPSVDGSARSSTLGWYLVVAWLMGAGLVVIHLRKAHQSARRLRLASVKVSDHPLRDLAQSFGLARLDIRKATGLPQPCIVEAFRPCLYLPAGEDVDEAVLVHELAHIRHRDYAWNSLSWFTYACFWFVPGFGRLAQETSLWQEAWADLVARRVSRIDPGSQARMLLKALSRPGAMPEAVIAYAGNAASAGRRIQAMYTSKHSIIFTTLAASLVLVAALPLRFEANDGRTPSRSRMMLRTADRGELASIVR